MLIIIQYGKGLVVVVVVVILVSESEDLKLLNSVLTKKNLEKTVFMRAQRAAWFTYLSPPLQAQPVHGAEVKHELHGRIAVVMVYYWYIYIYTEPNKALDKLQVYALQKHNG